MDKDLLIREFAAQIGVTKDMVINWEVRGIKPEGGNLEKIKAFLDG